MCVAFEFDARLVGCTGWTEFTVPAELLEGYQLMLLDNEGGTWNGSGLTPDIEAALTTDEQSSYYDFTVETDPQINRAVTALAALVS